MKRTHRLLLLCLALALCILPACSLAEEDGPVF